jgi:hypothetical protein
MVLRLQPGSSFRGRSFKNYLPNQVGNFHLQMHALWFNQCRSDLPEGHGCRILGLINKCVVVYLDDVTVYSKNREDHIQHLTQIFKRCRKYGISLNPKKTIFGVEEGKLLGHIISQAGIHIDPERIKAIAQLPFASQQEIYAVVLRENQFCEKVHSRFRGNYQTLTKDDS